MKKRIEKLIINGDLYGAAKLLKLVNVTRNEATHLLSQIEKLNKDVIIGVLGFEKETMIRNQIIDKLLKLSDRLNENTLKPNQNQMRDIIFEYTKKLKRKIDYIKFYNELMEVVNAYDQFKKDKESQDRPDLWLELDEVKERYEKIENHARSIFQSIKSRVNHLNYQKVESQMQKLDDFINDFSNSSPIKIYLIQEIYEFLLDYYPTDKMLKGFLTNIISKSVTQWQPLINYAEKMLNQIKPESM